MSSGIAMAGSKAEQGGRRMRMFLLAVGTLILLALGGLEVIAAHNLAVTEGLSAPSVPWK